MAKERTIIISKNCKLESKNNYLVIRSDKEERIFINEIATLIIESTAVAITTALISDLIEEGIHIIFCNSKHLPNGCIIPTGISFDSPRKIHEQMGWEQSIKGLCWKYIVQQKIKMQASMLKIMGLDAPSLKLTKLVDCVDNADTSNYEAQAAREYFYYLLGETFNRNDPCNINSCLNYGYAILMSFVAREIAAKGYLNEIGIWHRSISNSYNFACDLMEVFRPCVDYVALEVANKYRNSDYEFERSFKHDLLYFWDVSVVVNGQTLLLPEAIRTFLNRIFKFLNQEENSLFEIDFSDKYYKTS